MNPFIVLRLCATGINTQQNTLVSGIPSLPGIAGFAHHLERRTGHKIVDFLPIFHVVEHNRGHTKFRPFSSGNLQSYSKVENPPTLDISTATVDLTLVLRLDDASLDYTCADVFPLYCNNLCGGKIVDMPEVEFAETTADLVKILRARPVGWVVRDRADMFVGSNDPINVLLDAVQRFKKGKNKKPVRNSRLVPLHIGYVLIEEPKDRPYMLRNPNDSYRHALAEPITGLAQFHFLHSEIKSDTAFDGCWWSYAPVQPGDRVFQIVSNRVTE